jgi:acyl dehydratase
VFSRTVFFLLAACGVYAQHEHDGMTDINAANMFQMNLASGTSVNPASAADPMLMKHYGSWDAMFMGEGFLADVQQSGSHGGDKLYGPNWFMGSVEHRAGAQGAFESEIMLSLDPATITNRSYPLLFQTGETAYGKPLVDAQHPHNFVMALGLRYTRRLADGTMLDLYAAPVGDPALGPVAYPHRASASELPQATISHHSQDSTHIADDVVTVGLARRKFKVEASGFHGREPGENRWTIETGGIDSWSGRVWFQPTPRWAAQVSAGRIAHPERLEAGDQFRVTGSVEYSRPLKDGSWSSSLIWGRTHSTASQVNLNSYLAESVLPVRPGHFLTGRAEVAEKNELFESGPLAGRTFRVGAYTIGYTRNISIFHEMETGIGANFTAYSLPDTLKPFYGERPVGGNVFLRIRLRNASN